MANYKEKLKPLIGRYFRHKSEQVVHRFLEIGKIRHDMISMRTDLTIFEFSIFDVSVFIEQFEEVETRNDVVILVPEKQKPSQAGSLTNFKPVLDDDTIISLRDTLLGNIKSLKENANFSTQAKNINNTVQTLINLTVMDLKIKASRNDGTV